MEELKIAAVQFSPEFESRVKEMVNKSGKKVSRPAVYKAKYFLSQHTDLPDEMQEKIILKSLEAALRTSQDNFEGTEFDHYDMGKKVALTCGENGISLKRIPTEIESEIQESFTGTNLSIRKSTVREAMAILDAQPDLTEEDKMNILIDSIEDTLEEQKMTDNYAGGEFDNFLFGENFHDNLMDTREDKLIDREEEEFDRKDSFVAEEDSCGDDWWWNMDGDPFDMESFSGNEYNNLFGLGNKKKKAERKAAKKERKAVKKERKAERKIQRAEKAAAKGKTKKASRLLKKADKKLDKADKKRYKGDLKKIKAGIKVDTGLADGRREVLAQQAAASGITSETNPEVNVVSQQLAGGAVPTEPTTPSDGGAMGGGGGGGGGEAGGEEGAGEEGVEEGAPEAGDMMSKLKDNKMLLGIGAAIVVIIVLILILRK